MSGFFFHCEFQSDALARALHPWTETAGVLKMDNFFAVPPGSLWYCTHVCQMLSVMNQSWFNTNMILPGCTQAACLSSIDTWVNSTELVPHTEANKDKAALRALLSGQEVHSPGFLLSWALRREADSTPRDLAFWNYWAYCLNVILSFTSQVFFFSFWGSRK